MRLAHLSLTNFRNYARLDLDFPGAITVLEGANAQGKTNLLEAIYYLAHASSPRARTDRELINWLANEEEMPFARVEASVEGSETLRELNIVLLRKLDRLQKEIRINGVKRRTMDLIGQLKTVLFMPEDIDLIAGSPDPRRHYLDTIISPIDHRYWRSLQVYNRVLSQRNSLLRALRERQANLEQLDFWNARLIGQGSYVLSRRLEVVADLDRLLQDIHPLLTGGTERLRLLYRSSLPLQGEEGPQFPHQLPLQMARAAQAMSGTHVLSSAHIEALFKQQLHASQGEEIERGMTLMGPHRDDLRFLVGGVDMCTYGSRGQQRTIATSLKLAEMELLRSATDEEPILLLDDVMSELDEKRRQYLMGAINREQQVIITSTDLTSFAPSFLEQAEVWRIDAGRLKKVSSQTPHAGGR